jgi:two-component sensor histidine kinase
MATLTVSDNGIGFATKAESKRHGVGLVHRLMEQVSGTASVASEHGTVWTMRFPMPKAA